VVLFYFLKYNIIIDLILVAKRELAPRF